MGLGPDQRRQLATLQEWCLGPAGRGSAATALRRTGLHAGHAEVDDLCQEVLVRCWRRISCRPLLEEPGRSAVEAYATRALRNAAKDIARGSARSRTHLLEEEHLDRLVAGSVGDEDDVPGDDGGQVRVGDPATIDAIRTDLHAQLAGPGRTPAPWGVAAAITTLLLGLDPQATAAADVRRPDPQTRAAHDGDLWAGLAYAGRTDCFETPDSSAVRERRSQALARVRSLLAGAIERTAAPSTEDAP